MGVEGLTVAEVKGFGRQKGHTENLPRRRIRGQLRAQGAGRCRGQRHSSPIGRSTPSPIRRAPAASATARFSSPTSAGPFASAQATPTTTRSRGGGGYERFSDTQHSAEPAPVPGACGAGRSGASRSAGPTPWRRREAKIDTGDTAWMLTATAIVLMMTIPGLALFYGGMVRKKNVLTMVMQVFATACIATIVLVRDRLFDRLRRRGTLLGWALQSLPQRRGQGCGLGQHPGNGVHDLSDDVRDHHPGIDRRRFRRPGEVLRTDRLRHALAHPGLRADHALGLGRQGLDPWNWARSTSAGGTVVHINSGIAGLVAAIIVGKRIGFGREDMAPHNLVLSLVGAALLWVGWFGFNARPPRWAPAPAPAWPWPSPRSLRPRRRSPG